MTPKRTRTHLEILDRAKFVPTSARRRRGGEGHVVSHGWRGGTAGQVSTVGTAYRRQSPRIIDIEPPKAKRTGRRHHPANLKNWRNI
jgi:hypothetical protein